MVTQLSISDQDVYRSICDWVRETKLLSSINALLEWDQQTQMPAKASAYRSDQITCMAGMIHERETDSRVGDWLEQLSKSSLMDDRHSEAAANIRELRHRYQKKSRLPLDLVQRQAALHSNGQQIWIQARKDNDFASFAATLNEIIQLKREEAQATLPSLAHHNDKSAQNPACLYDALLDDYETGAVTSEVASALAGLRDALVPLIAKSVEATKGSDCETGVLRRSFPVETQKAFVRKATEAIGFAYDRGRVDIAHHPFCTEVGPNDVRMTTRYDESYFPSAFFGSLHEAGHGMYEQGLPSDQYGLPAGSYCSLGIHESQSRLWENTVGRSHGFWKYFLGMAQQHFPISMADQSVDCFVASVNQIRPSLIRVEADEATYNMHIIIRFELEQALLNDELPVSDLPAAWNEKYESYLGVVSPTDSDGVLQDIHWSAGLVGYFPTYSLGNIFACQLFEQATSELGDLETMFAEGNFATLLNWLVQNVHSKGKRYRANELMEMVTGSSLDPAPLVRHLTKKTELQTAGRV